MDSGCRVSSSSESNGGKTLGRRVINNGALSRPAFHQWATCFRVAHVARILLPRTAYYGISLRPLSRRCSGLGSTVRDNFPPCVPLIAPMATVHHRAELLVAASGHNRIMREGLACVHTRVCACVNVRAFACALCACQYRRPCMHHCEIRGGQHTAGPRSRYDAPVHDSNRARSHSGGFPHFPQPCVGVSLNVSVGLHPAYEHAVIDRGRRKRDSRGSRCRTLAYYHVALTTISSYYNQKILQGVLIRWLDRWGDLEFLK